MDVPWRAHTYPFPWPSLSLLWGCIGSCRHLKGDLGDEDLRTGSFDFFITCVPSFLKPDVGGPLCGCTSASVQLRARMSMIYIYIYHYTLIIIPAFLKCSVELRTQGSVQILPPPANTKSRVLAEIATPAGQCQLETVTRGSTFDSTSTSKI